MSCVPGSLKKSFELVRAEFFPRWDGACQWRCRRMTSQLQCHGDGLCVPATHTIYITRKLLRLSRPQRLGVIIHEICHAVLPRSSHGAPWQRRMIRAAMRAETLGEHGLAKWLREEVRRYVTPPGRLTGKSTYQEIRDFVRESGTVPSFKAMVEEFSRSRLMTPGQFQKRYPRARKVYDAGLRSSPERAVDIEEPNAWFLASGTASMANGLSGFCGGAVQPKNGADSG